MERLRAEGGMRTNSFVRLSRVFSDGQPELDVNDLGDSENVLKNRALLAENARALLKRGVSPTEDGWGGWLGRYQSALPSAAAEILQKQERHSAQLPDRRRDHSRGR
jgi:hypothetical protein